MCIIWKSWYQSTLTFHKRVNNGTSYVLLLDSEKVSFQLNMNKDPPVIPKLILYNSENESPDVLIFCTVHSVTINLEVAHGQG